MARQHSRQHGGYLCPTYLASDGLLRLQACDALPILGPTVTIHSQAASPDSGVMHPSPRHYCQANRVVLTSAMLPAALSLFPIYTFQKLITRHGIRRCISSTGPSRPGPSAQCHSFLVRLATIPTTSTWVPRLALLYQLLYRIGVSKLQPPPTQSGNKYRITFIMQVRRLIIESLEKYRDMILTNMILEYLLPLVTTAKLSSVFNAMRFTINGWLEPHSTAPEAQESYPPPLAPTYTPLAPSAPAPPRPAANQDLLRANLVEEALSTAGEAENGPANAPEASQQTCLESMPSLLWFLGWLGKYASNQIHLAQKRGETLLLLTR